MALRRIWAALLGASMMAGPALAQDSTPPAPPAPPAPVAPAPPPATTGRIYISYAVQPHADFPSQFALDDAWLSNAIAPGTCIYFELPPGSHTLHTLAETKLTADLTAGASKYVELFIRHTYVQGTAQDTITPRFADSIADTGACKATDAP